MTISSDQTQNMDCSNGVCSPTAADAVLNVFDLENFLASGNLEITTTGSGVQADDINVTAPVSWSTGSTLSLDAYNSINVESQISIDGQAGLSLATNDGGKGGLLSFASGGDVTFANLSSQLTVNGKSFSLVSDIASLASGIAANPTGNFALANPYDASGDGTYDQSPIPTTFSGSFEGLGNTISNLTIQNSMGSSVGLFATVVNATLAHIGLANESASSSINTKYLGGLAGYAEKSTIDQADVAGSISAAKAGHAGGLIGETKANHTSRSFATNSVSVDKSGGVGGLVGLTFGGDVISLSYATGNVSAGDRTLAGGLVGEMCGKVDESYAIGATTVGRDVSAGGLVGGNCGGISNSYATGSVSASTKGVFDNAGGLLGNNSGKVTSSYSIGEVAKTLDAGGLIGYDTSTTGSLKKNYWDTTTSGITNLSQGAGNIANDPGITGKTTHQLQSKLPKGFSPKIWGEDSNINGGLPYLLANPPRK